MTSRFVLLATVSLLASTDLAGAKPTYVSFGVAGAFDTGGSAINSSGTVAGSYMNPSGNSLHGFVRTPDGTITTFDVSGSVSTEVYDINDNGETDGWWRDANSQHGFVRDAAGNVTSFDPTGSLSTQPGAMNANGDVAGTYTDANNVAHGFIRSGSDGSITSFDVAGAKGTSAYGINAADTVSGYFFDSSNKGHGFVRTSDGTVTSFDPTGSIGTQAWAINDSGVIAGQYSDSGNFLHGFVRAADGTITAFDPPGSINTSVALFGLNQNGDVGGYYSFKPMSRGKTRRSAFIRASDGTITTYVYPRNKSGTYGGGLNTGGVATGGYVIKKNRSFTEYGYIRTP